MHDHAFPAASQRKLRTLFRAASVVTISASAGLLLYGVWLLAHPESLKAVLSAGLPPGSANPAPAELWAAAALAAIPGAIFIAIMGEFRRLFRRVAEGAFLSSAFTGSLRRLGWLAIASGAAGLAINTLVPLVLTYSNPPGQKMLVIAISSAQVAGLVIGLLFFMLTHVFAEVTRIEEDNRSIV